MFMFKVQLEGNGHPRRLAGRRTAGGGGMARWHRGFLRLECVLAHLNVHHDAEMAPMSEDLLASAGAVLS